MFVRQNAKVFFLSLVPLGVEKFCEGFAASWSGFIDHPLLLLTVSPVGVERFCGEIAEGWLVLTQSTPSPSLVCCPSAFLWTKGWDKKQPSVRFIGFSLLSLTAMVTAWVFPFCTSVPTLASLGVEEYGKEFTAGGFDLA